MFPGGEVQIARSGRGERGAGRRWESTGPGPRRKLLVGVLAVEVVAVTWFLTGVPLPAPLHVHSRAELEQAAADFNRIAPLVVTGWGFCPELSTPSARIDPWRNRVDVFDSTARGDQVLERIPPDRRELYHLNQSTRLAACDGP
ncbi:MAG: hypothetical protein U0Q07_13645 [Acidimicrobiales bacterium]